MFMFSMVDRRNPSLDDMLLNAFKKHCPPCPHTGNLLQLCQVNCCGLSLGLLVPPSACPRAQSLQVGGPFAVCHDSPLLMVQKSG